MKTTTSIRVRWKLPRRKRFAAEHPSVRWTRHPSREISTGLKSPCVGYAAAKNQSMRWPKEVLRTGWFPLLLENTNAMRSEESRGGDVVK